VTHLPSYSPDYNPIEFLWRATKRTATHNRYFPAFDDLRTSVEHARPFLVGFGAQESEGRVGGGDHVQTGNRAYDGAKAESLFNPALT
jgi:hypothetical protein